MKSKLLLLFVLFWFKGTLIAQPFCSFSGIDIANETAQSLIKTFDGGYVTTGKSDSAFTKRAFVYKYDALGNLEWTRIFTSTYSCEGFSIVQTTDSALVMVGALTTASTVNGIEIFVAKLKSDGTVLFQQTVGNNSSASDESAFAATASPDGGVLMVCQTNKNLASAIDLLLVKISASGSVLWAKDLIDSYYAEVPVAIKRDVHNNYLVSGYLIPAISSNPMFYDMFLIKLDSIGNVKWAKTLGGSKFDQANSLQILSNDAGYAICGRTESYVPATAASAAYLVVLDTAGNIKWSHTFNLSGFQLVEFNDISADPITNALSVCGFIQGYDNNDVSLIVQYDSTGTVLWNRIYENYQNSYSSFRSIVSSSTGFGVCGKTNRFNFSENIQLLSLDTLGNSCCLSDSLPAFVVDSGYYWANWILTDTLANTIIPNSSAGSNFINGGGVYSYCVTTGQITTSSNADLHLFPNPGNGHYTLQGNENTNETIAVNVINATGQTVYQKSVLLQPSMQLDLFHLPNGIYLIQGWRKGNKVLSQKLVKE